MGPFGIIDKFVDGVSGVAEKVKRTAEWVKEIADTLGLPKLGEIAKNTADRAGVLVVAPTFILEQGQKRIEKMLKSCGEGQPEDGMSFLDAGRAFKQAVPLVDGAFPNDDWSDSKAADRYAAKNDQQRTRVVTLADLDSRLHTLISAEANLLPPIRASLENHHKSLADFGNLTQYFGAMGRYGKGAQYTIETIMVASTLAMAIPEYEGMQDEADAIAQAVAQVGDEYKRIADGVSISDSANDFDPPKPPRPGR
ncbi:EspA/EspE family type VII secretion system effector [Mycobacterium syngnathidarum]